MLDYDAASKRAASEKDLIKAKPLKEELQIAKNTYEALNRQLIEELPKLIDLSKELFLNSIAALLKIKKMFIGKAAKQALILLDLPLLQSSSYMGEKIGQIRVNLTQLLVATGSIEVKDIRQTFTVKHNLIIDDMLSNFSIVKFGKLSSHDAPMLERNTSMRSSSSSDTTGYVKRFIGKSAKSETVLPQVVARLDRSRLIQFHFQTTNAKESIQNRFAPTDIYCANTDYQALDVLDLAIRANEWVGVVKRQDPMGNTQRWFVDNGLRQGFVPCKYLSQVST